MENKRCPICRGYNFTKDGKCPNPDCITTGIYAPYWWGQNNFTNSGYKLFNLKYQENLNDNQRR